MKTYLLDLIPKIQQYSQKLDDLTILTNKQWVLLDETSKIKTSFIFRSKECQLLISKNGIIEKGNWDYLGNNSILLEFNDESYLFKHGFIDNMVLALKVDGTDEYAILINDELYSNSILTISNLIDFFKTKYIHQNTLVTRSRLKSSLNGFNRTISEVKIPSNIQSKISYQKSFLTNSLIDINYYIKFFNSDKYPFYAALILDDQKVKLENDHIYNLLTLAKNNFKVNSINEVLDSL